MQWELIFEQKPSDPFGAVGGLAWLVAVVAEAVQSKRTCGSVSTLTVSLTCIVCLTILPQLLPVAESCQQETLLALGCLVSLGVLAVLGRLFLRWGHLRVQQRR